MQLHWWERCEPAHMGEALILPIEAKHSASQYLFEGWSIVKLAVYTCATHFAGVDVQETKPAKEMKPTRLHKPVRSFLCYEGKFCSQLFSIGFLPTQLNNRICIFLWRILGHHQRANKSLHQKFCPLNSATVLVSSRTIFWRDLTYSTASSSISDVLVCLTILGTTCCNFFIRSLIRVRRTRSAILRGWVAHPRFARVP